MITGVMRPRDLSVDQRAVFDQVTSWSRGRSGLFTFGGLAGTGKTTVLGVLAAEFARMEMTVAYITVTGRASSILARKLKAAGAGITEKLRRTAKDPDADTVAGLYDDNLLERGGPAFCGTLHRLIYRPVVDEETEEVWGFVPRKKLDRRYDLVVIDEASMVSEEMLSVLRTFDIPILAVGDHGQLPPVASNGSIVAEPMARLEKIHRQAEGNPIVALAMAVRQGKPLSSRFADGERVRFISKALLKRELAAAGLSSHLAQEEQTIASLRCGMICWTNRCRVWLNTVMRKAAGYDGIPRAGEPVICLKNEPPVFNGMRGKLTRDVVEDAEHPWLLDASIEFPEEGLLPEDFTLCAPQFNREKTYESVEELVERGIPARKMSQAGSLFDFGYCLTAHKAQGSEFDLGMVYLDREEKPYDDDWRRWSYTAITRAKERLAIFT